MNRALPLRPHHALCLHFFVGRGYGGDFVAGMAAVQKKLWEHPDEEVILTVGADAVCAGCPNNIDGTCNCAEKSSRYDEECLSAFGLKSGQVLPWRKLKQLALRTVVLSPVTRASICSDCQWNAICRKQQEKLCSAVCNSHN